MDGGLLTDSEGEERRSGQSRRETDQTVRMRNDKGDGPQGPELGMPGQKSRKMSATSALTRTGCTVIATKEISHFM